MAAGIGGGYGGTGGTITINGGTITATGSNNSAGIGGSCGSGGTIAISGGIVTATGGAEGAGIGGGAEGAGGNITISGGTVTATGGGYGGAGIGGGGDGGVAGGGSGGTIAISGGIVTATGANGASNIGAGAYYPGYGGSTSITGNCIVFEGNAGTVYGDATLAEDFEIPSGKTLTIPNGSSLTIASGRKLTNNGDIVNSGTFTNGGTLQIGSGGTTGSLAGNISVNGGSMLTFYRSGDVTYGGVISGTGSLLQNGMNTLILTGDNTYTGGTYINAGTLQIGNGGTTGRIAGDIVNNGALVFNRSGNPTYGGVISGTGSLTKEGIGELFLTNNNTYTGGTTINEGVLRIDGTTGSVAGDIVNNGHLVFYRFDDLTYDGVISGTGILSKVGMNTLILTGDNTYTGDTYINEGALRLTSEGAVSGTSGFFTADQGTLELYFDGDYTKNIYGFGNLTADVGFGNTLTLYGTHAYAGTTTVLSGTVIFYARPGNDAITAELGSTITNQTGVTITVNGRPVADGESYTVAKAVSVGAQSGTLTAGTSGSATFTVTTAYIADGAYTVTLGGAPAGVTAGTVAIASGSGTLTVSTTAATPSGTHPLTLTIDGATSAGFNLVVNPAPVIVTPNPDPDPTIYVTGVSLNLTSLEGKVGDDGVELVATVSPRFATDRNVRWSTSDPLVATVTHYGRVDFVGAGTATITVITLDGDYTADCVVTVSSDTGTEGIDSALKVYFQGSTLYVSSPAAETIEVYSFNGERIFSAKKGTGEASFIVPTSLKAVIVRGSSGWTKKAITNYELRITN
jgi:autotransporter-associated beta strand protein